MTNSPGRVALVTGAGSGIGAAVTQRFLKAGISVVGLDVSFGTESSTERLRLVSGDVRDPDIHAAAVEIAREQFGGLDIAVFNAGITTLDPSPGTIDPGLLDDILAINVKGVALGMAAALPALRERPDASVVVTASVSGMAGDSHMWPYNASKAAVINMVRSWSIDHARAGVRVNAVCPGPIRTTMTDALHTGPGKELGDALVRNVPLGRWGTPDEVAAAIEFLTSEAASFITGTTLVVDGGILAGTGQFPPPG